MAKQLPKTIAEKYIDRLHEKWPGMLIAELEDTTRYRRLELQGEELPNLYYFLAVGALTRDGYSKKDIQEIIQDPLTATQILSPDDIYLDIAWAKCKQVYRFNQELSDELYQQQLTGKLPIDVIKQIPYPIMFVEAPVSISTTTGKTRSAKGFFVYIETWRGVERLVFHFVHDDGHKNALAFTLENKESVEDIIVELETNLRLALVDNETEEVLEDSAFEVARTRISHILNLLIYINSENADAEVVYKPSGLSRKPKISQATITSVGSKIGPALGAARTLYLSNEDGHTGTGKKKAPHVRRGHWHAYWRGKKDGSEERRLVVKWQPPIEVGFGDDAATTVHDVE